MKFRLGTLLLLFFLAVAITKGQQIPTNKFSQDSSKRIILIKSSGIIYTNWLKKKEFEKRRAPITIDQKLLSPNNIKKRDIFEIPIFEEKLLIARPNQIFVDINNVLSISGKIEGFKMGYFYLSIKEGICLATIEILDKNEKYTITYDRASHVHYFTELDPHKIENQECATPLKGINDN